MFQMVQNIYSKGESSPHSSQFLSPEAITVKSLLCFSVCFYAHMQMKCYLFIHWILIEYPLCAVCGTSIAPGAGNPVMKQKSKNLSSHRVYNAREGKQATIQ